MGVGAQPPGPSPEGRHHLRTSAGVGGYQPDHPLLQRHGCVVSQAADVALVMDGDGPNAVDPGFVYGHAHCPLGDHEAEAPVAVDHRRAGGLPLHHERRAGNNVALVDALDVFGDVNHAVGVVTNQVGFDLVGGDGLRLFVGRALGPENMVSDLMQIVRRENGHNRTPWLITSPSRMRGVGLVYRWRICLSIRAASCDRIALLLCSGHDILNIVRAPVAQRIRVLASGARDESSILSGVPWYRCSISSFRILPRCQCR